MHNHSEDPAAPGATARSLSILIAEDNDFNRTILTDGLTQDGHRVTAVRNGREAVAAWHCGVFDLILMDIEMAAMNGLEATREIREAEARRGAGRTPIVAVTAYAMPEDRRRCLAAGMDDYIVKPVDLQGLRRRFGGGGGSPPAHRPPGAADDGVLDGPEEAGARRLYVALLRKDLAAEFAGLERALQARDRAGVGRCAHTLKGLAGHLAAGRMSQLAGEIRGLADAGDLEAIAQPLAALRAALECFVRRDATTDPHGGVHGT